ncbi:MAG TPA: hypothetical protein VF211_01400 [Burkholderiales bacterium]
MKRAGGADIARFVIPAAIGVWLVGIVISREGVPGWVRVAAGVATAAFILALLGFLLVRQSGWRELARRYPGDRLRAASWRSCRTAILSRVGRAHPAFRRSRLVLRFLVRVDADERALHLSLPWPVALVLPPISIPWSQVAAIERFEPPGWMPPQGEAGTVANVLYDPGYRGGFFEIEVAEPTWFLQLPAHLVGRLAAVDALAGRG